ncbi:MAG: FAD-binding oxidoreductase [Actinobacteria bacterium]|nr:FAD-binding oxidoreductase [Actinomycetota bacterium]MCL6094666.1 FAD-binding oxidoreductase [Actinomycetota bacterium]
MSLEEELRKVVGEVNVIDDPVSLSSYEVDWTRRFQGKARCAVRPKTTEEVSAVVKLCADYGCPIVPQGGNTGLTGGSVPRGGEVVLSLKRLDGIGEIDDASGQITAEAGVTLSRLQRYALQHGYEYPVDFGARDSATVGGMVATNAGGMQVMAFGSTRAQVLGLEAVLASGEVISHLGGLVKDNTGYDIAGLLTGSEGTLAVVTAARLRLVPKAPYRATALIALDSTADAVNLLQDMRKSLEGLRAVEIMYREGVEMVSRQVGLQKPFDVSYPVYLTVEVAGRHDPVDNLLDFLSTAPGVLDSAIGTDSTVRERLWAYREWHPEISNRTASPQHVFDVTIPQASLAEFESSMRQLVASFNHELGGQEVQLVVWGHLGDGNLHLSVQGPSPSDTSIEEKLLRHVASFGGSISAEHGVGIAKSPWLSLCRSNAEIAAMKAIKRSLDPKGLLNPGVIFSVD